MNKLYDEQQIRQWFDIFKNGNELTEIRLISNEGKTASGYFTNVDTMIEAVAPYTKNFSVYFTINLISPDVYGRPQKDIISTRVKNTTADSEIIKRKFVLLDLDPKRATGVNATEEQLNFAKKKANEIYQFLKDTGFYPPIVICSGSGVHLYLACDLEVSEKTDNIIKRFTQAISMLFSDDKVDVDEKVFNRARIARCCGYYNRKGSSEDTERPQRMCRFVKIPNEIEINKIEYFEKIANLYPEEQIKPNYTNNYSSEAFDLDTFIQKHNIPVTHKLEVTDGTRYYLEHCLFNAQHKGKDAILFRHKNGAIAYFCYHNSCRNYTWRDVRLMYEPDAYSKKEYGEFKQRQRYNGNYQHETYQIQKEDTTKGKKWLSMSDIKNIDLSSMVTIPTGYIALDKKIMGLLLGDVTVLSGGSGAGKSSWLDCVILNVIQRGFKVAVWSGELQDFRFQSWINQIAAGKNHVRKKEGFDNFYYTPRMISDKINSWLDGKLFLYNNEYGNVFAQIFDDLKQCVDEFGVQLIVLDNLMALNIENYGGDKYSQQTKLINDIKEFAKKKNVHIILVCHPRKEVSNTLLRKESISGTADLTNMADQVLILHRVGDDFERRAKEFWGALKVQEMMKYSAVLEVVKNRSFGIVDFVVGMYYEQESRRLKNEVAEHIVYGWEDTEYKQIPTQEPMIEEIPQEAIYTEPNDDFLPLGKKTEDVAPF